MSPTSYKQTSALTSVAATLFANRKTACALAPYVVMTDPVRTPDVLATAEALPKKSVLIYRHFGVGDLDIAHQLRLSCFARGAQFLIGKDWQMAMACGADGVHLPETDLDNASVLRARFSDWLITAAVHDAAAMEKANMHPLDAVMISPVFKTAYRGGRTPLGLDGFHDLANLSHHPVMALGGINTGNAHRLQGLPIAGIAGVSAFT